MRILGIETSCDETAAAVVEDGSKILSSAVAVTKGPGLVGSLLVGITYAKSICFARGLPLIGVNHIEGHIHAVVLEAGGAIEYPALALVVSGGHTHIFEVRENFAYRLLGKTRDAAAGEAHDKVA